MSTRLGLLTAVTAATLALVPALAQTTAAPAAPGPARRDVAVERRITELHSKLKITPAEQKPFDAFADAMRGNAQRVDEQVAKRDAASPSATAVEQMKAYADLAQTHATEVSNLVGPFSTLYDSLSPDQKKMADQSFRDFARSPRGLRGAARG